MFYVIAILIFGVLIATHELGHFAAAKGLGVRVNEFSVGMGPALLSVEKGETLYSIRALPIGGYCAMEGEDEDSADPRAFGRAASWKRFVILFAGAAMNFLTGLLILLILNLPVQGFVQPAIAGFTAGFELEDCGLLPGDQVLTLNGHRMYNYSNLRLFLSRAGDDLDMVVLRDGQRVTLKNLHLPLIEVGKDQNGHPIYQRGLQIKGVIEPPTLANKLRFTFYDAMDYVRLVWISLGDLVSGRAGVQDLSGMVGITNIMAEVGSNQELSPTPTMAARNMAGFAALIAVNLAVMNLLPLPALDGGRLFFLLLNVLLTLLFRRKIDEKYENYVHMAGMAALMLLMLVVTFNDVSKLIGR